MSPDDATVPGRGLRPGLVGSDGTLPPLTQWIKLAQTREVIGSCRICGGILHAIEPDVEHSRPGEEGQVTHYEIRCAKCGKETSAPNGRTFAKSSAWSKTPPGWLEHRNGVDEETVKQRAGYGPDGHPGDRPRRGRGRRE